MPFWRILNIATTHRKRSIEYSFRFAPFFASSPFDDKHRLQEKYEAEDVQEDFLVHDETAFF